MARSRTAPSPPSLPGFDKTGAPDAQAAAPPDDPVGRAAIDEVWDEGEVHRGRLRVRTLVTLRWLVLAGEVVLLLGVIGLGFSVPYPLCFAVVAAGAWVNLLTGVASPGQRVFG